MKSFSQFLHESYLSEGVAPGERSARRRKPSKSVEQLKAEIDARDKARAQRGPTGAAARPDLQFKSNKVQSPANSSAIVPYNAPPKPTAPTQKAPSKPETIVKATTSTPTVSQQSSSPSVVKPQKPVEVRDVTNPRRSEADLKRRRAAAGTGPSGKPFIGQPGKSPSGSKPPAEKLPKPEAAPSGGKPLSGPKPTGKFGKALKVLGPAATALDVGLSTADERSKGSGWKRSLAKGAAVAAGGLAGGALGAIGGGGIGSAALGTAGAIGGAEAAGKAFDVAAGANAKERKAMATANRQRQSGTAIKGIGGPTSFDTKKNTMTTGTGAQRKTVGLAKTGVVQRGGQSTTGYLAYKGGKAVYKAGPSAQSLAKTSSNPLERIGRSLFAGAYKKSDAANAAKNLAKARQSDAARNKALGVKSKPAG